MNEALKEIRADWGATQRIADACGVTHSAVSQWVEVPPRHVLTVARLTGVPPFRLRPDMYEEGMTWVGSE